MSGVEVRPVRFPQDIRAFIDTWWRVYDGNPNWVPPLRMDISRFLNPKRNPYFRTAEVQPFIAYRDGVAVGTIAATDDRELRKHEPDAGLFGFFEFVDDPAVSAALFDAARQWLAARGVGEARGPFNFNSNHEFGLLVDGFDDPPCIANPYNAAYYEAHYQALGLQRARDWYAYLMERKPIPDTVKKIAERFMSRHPEVEIRPLDPSRFWEQAEAFWEIYNDAWEDNWGHVYMQREEFMDKARALKAVLDPRLAYLAYVDGEVAAASITLPDYNQVALKMNGRLFPFGWWHLLVGRRRIDRLRVLVLGVKKKFQSLPLGAPLYMRTWDEAWDMGCKSVEASLILEDNHRMRGALEKLGGEIHKTYRTYTVSLRPPAADPS